MNIIYFFGNVSRLDGGIYQYSLNALNIIANLNIQIHVVTIGINNKNEENIRKRDLLEIVNKYKNLKLVALGNDYLDIIKPFQFPINFTSIRIIGGLFRLVNKIFLSLFNILKIKPKNKIQFYIKKNKIDLIHIPYQDSISNIQVPIITTIHDLQELIFPQFFSSSQRLERAKRHKFAIDNSSRIIVSYDDIKNDVFRFYNKPLELIDVNCIDMNVSWLGKFDNQESNYSFNIPEKYIIQAASTWEHKNHLGVLQAIKYLRDSKAIIVNYIITGNKTPYFKTLNEFVESNNLQTQVYFLGLVDEKELISLYKNSRGLIVPNLYEAGSIPMCECMNLGVPIICSEIPTLKEVMLDRRFMFDPKNIPNIVEKIELMFSNDNFRKMNIENSNKIVMNNNIISLSQNFYSIYKKC